MTRIGTLAQAMMQATIRDGWRCPSDYHGGNSQWNTDDGSKYASWDQVDQAVKERVLEACTMGPWPILFKGQVGAGKSCIGLLLLRHYGGAYIDLPTLCQLHGDAKMGTLMNKGSAYSASANELWKDLHGANLVVLDEIGTREKSTDHQYETLKFMLDRRESGALILISNLDVPGLVKAYDDRIASRMLSGTIIEMAGDKRMA